MHRLFDGHACRVAFLFSGTYQIAARKLSNERCALQLATNFVQHILISQHPKGIKSARGCWKYCLAKDAHTRAAPKSGSQKSRHQCKKRTGSGCVWAHTELHLAALQQQIINANPDPVCLLLLLSLPLLQFRPKLDLPKSAKLPVDADRL